MIESTPIKNYVLVKLKKNDYISTESGIKLYIPPEDSQENKEAHRSLVGEVIRVPEKLEFVQGDYNLSQWETELEIKEGDEVTMRRPAVTMALSKDSRHGGRHYEKDGEVYIWIKYNELVVAKRDGEVIMLNGFILVEPDDVSLPESSIPGFEHAQTAKKKSTVQGTIRYLGTPNKRYHITKDSKGYDVIEEDPDELEVGDRIIFMKATDIPLEQPLHQTFEGNKLFYRMQRKKVLCKLN